MTETTPQPADGLRLGYFTRLLDETGPAQRYANATEQIVLAERLGFDSAWVAQHHFHALEGGLPSPAVFLASVAAQTKRIRLGFGVITLPLEHPLRVAEDVAVLDELSDRRVEVGFGTGGTPSSFRAFGHDVADRRDIYDGYLRAVTDAWTGADLGDPENQLYPPAQQLGERVWEATFSAGGAAAIGARGSGLLLSRTQPRPEDAPGLSLAEIQEPVVAAYRAALPAGVAPRIAASRTVFVADDERTAAEQAERGLRTVARRGGLWGLDPEASLEDLKARTDSHAGTSDQVIASLGRDTVLSGATDLLVQVHSIDPPHELVLRSIELIATDVAPALGWRSHLAAAGIAQ